jgi:hypothetical protein
VDTTTPIGSRIFTGKAALAEMEFEITGERITDSVSKRREAGEDRGGRRRFSTDSQVTKAVRVMDAGDPGYSGYPGRARRRQVDGDLSQATAGESRRRRRRRSRGCDLELRGRHGCLD